MKKNRKIAVSLAIGMGVYSILSPIVPVVNAQDITVPRVEQKTETSSEIVDKLSENIKSEAKKEETVSNFTDLKEKVENPDVKAIKISDNIEFTEAIKLDRDIEIDGGKHKFTYKLGEETENRFFLNKEKNAKIYLKNIEFIGIDGQKDGRKVGGIEK